MNPIEETLLNIKDLISPLEHEKITNFFKELEEKADKEEKIFAKKNFISRYKIYKKNLICKKKWKTTCSCGEHEICVISKEDFLKCKNKDKFIFANPFLKIMCGEIIKINFYPNLDVYSDTKILSYNLINLILLAENLEYYDKYLIVINIAYFAIKNIYLLISDKSVAICVNSIIEAFLSDQKFISFMGELGLETEMFMCFLRIPLIE